MDIDFKNLAEIQAARQERQLHLRTIGVNEEFISELVVTFYDKVQADAILGPIFNNEITDWAPHLEKMKLFWKNIVLKENVYVGKPVPAHTKLVGVKSDDFDRWLYLFRTTLEELTADMEIHIAFLEPANRIAQRLSSMMDLAD